MEGMEGMEGNWSSLALEVLGALELGWKYYWTATGQCWTP